MSKLTESVSIKVSKETKQFLDSIDNSSDYIRSLIRHSMIMNNELSEHFEIVTRDGDEYYSFDEEKLEDTLKEIASETFKNALSTIIKQRQ